MKQILSCIDGSAMTRSVCDAGAWASKKLQSPLTLLHVLEKTNTPVKDDLSGIIGLGSREHLLDELTALDEQRSKVALEHGKQLLAAAERYAKDDGATQILKIQRHGDLLNTILELEKDTRLLVIGRLGEDHSQYQNAIGSHLESVVRALHEAILVSVAPFRIPRNFMIAYDGSPTANAAIERVAASPLLKGLDCHLVMVAERSELHLKQLDDVQQQLSQGGFAVQSSLVEGGVHPELERYQRQHDIDLVVMGAYGHSRIRQFFVGSNTAKMISSSQVALLLLR